MDKREQDRSELLPEASEGFTRAILDGADDIYRYRTRQRRVRRLALAAAALVLLAVGVGLLLDRWNAPRPDTVLAPNPTGVVAVPTATPQPTATPRPEPTLRPSRIDAESGWEYLDDAGPFEEGEWLVLTDADGCLAYGGYVPFHEQPSPKSRCVNAVNGMRVRYLGQADEGFARVLFAGQEGYVPADQLRRGAPGPELDGEARYLLDHAALYATDPLGRCRAVFIDIDGENTVKAYALQKLLEDLVPAEDAEPGPMNALLLARFLDPTDDIYPNGAPKYVDLRLALSLDEGDYLFMDEEGRLLTGDSARNALGGIDDTIFWTVFHGIYADTSVYS